MIATQLDLFGSPPKPPAKIMEDDPETDFQTEEPKPDKIKHKKGAVPEKQEAPVVESGNEILSAPTLPALGISVIMPAVASAHLEAVGVYVQRPTLTETVPGIQNEASEDVFKATDKTEVSGPPVEAKISDSSTEQLLLRESEVTGSSIESDLSDEAVSGLPSPETKIQTASVEESGSGEDPVKELTIEIAPETILPFAGSEEREEEASKLRTENPAQQEIILATEEAESNPADDVETPSLEIIEKAETGQEEEAGPNNLEDKEASAGELPAGQKGELNIPPDEDLFKRQYYSMRETANMLGVNQSLLRFWENEFSILKPKKNKKGDRYFRPIDIKHLQLIYHLLRVRKFTIEGAREYLKNTNRALDNFTLVERMVQLKTFLQELKVNL